MNDWETLSLTKMINESKRLFIEMQSNDVKWMIMKQFSYKYTSMLCCSSVAGMLPNGQHAWYDVNKPQEPVYELRNFPSVVYESSVVHDPNTLLDQTHTDMLKMLFSVRNSLAIGFCKAILDVAQYLSLYCCVGMYLIRQYLCQIVGLGVVLNDSYLNTILCWFPVTMLRLHYLSTSRGRI